MTLSLPIEHEANKLLSRATATGGVFSPEWAPWTPNVAKDGSSITPTRSRTSSPSVPRCTGSRGQWPRGPRNSPGS